MPIEFDAGRDALLRTLVMSAIANDYEDFATVVQDVSGWAAEEGVQSGEDEIWAALFRLIRLGLANAYQLSATCTPPEAVSEIRPEAREQYRFLLTRQGRVAMSQEHVSEP